MMKSKQTFRTFIMIFLGIISYSCETVVDVDIPFDKPQVTMNTVLKANGFPKVRLTFSKHALDNNYIYEPIKNAQVYLESEGVSYELEFEEENGIYKTLDFMIQAGKHYTVSANVPDYQVVTATETIPEIVPIKNFSYNGETQKDSWNVEQDITILFDDPVGENYYEISGYSITKTTYLDQNGNEQEHIDFRNLYLNPKNPTYQNDYGSSNTVLINDQLFEGQEAKIDMFSWGTHFSPEVDSEIYIILKSVTESYYKFHTTFGLQRWNDGDPFAQPVQVFTNIQNGMGIITGESSFTYQVK
ncbi:DUF4249 domain-containing protein [Belliella marina]|uniref:DUF4249 domain-containing protein n=1 Tax=Belliella marina TaxID=1644146 RepID=A0ABW4VHK1_9BACT